MSKKTTRHRFREEVCYQHKPLLLHNLHQYYPFPTPPRPDFNPGQALYSLLHSQELRYIIFVNIVSYLFLRYFCCYYFKPLFSKARIHLLKFRRWLILSFSLHCEERIQNLFLFYNSNFRYFLLSFQSFYFFYRKK
jgi:hypothetical protein